MQAAVAVAAALLMKQGEGEMPCFWLEPNGQARLILRRFTFHSDAPCSASAYGHDASVVVEDLLPVVWRTEEDGRRVQEGVPAERVPPHDDPRWPTACKGCGEEFGEDAQWQAALAEGYVRSDTGVTVWTRHVHGVEWAGALYDAEWLHADSEVWRPYNARAGEDGIILAAVCPNGALWVVDGEATGGGRWTRTGDPRDPASLSVTPSIVAGDYHGFLQGGRFTPHLG